MKRLLPFVIIVLVGAIAVASGAWLYRAKKAEMAALASAAEAAGKAGGKQSGANPPHVRGEKEAPITLEEFGDFQCPPCGILSPTLGKLEHEYGERVRVIFRQFPLKVHSHAEQAARSAEAAGRQGRFWEMHDLLYKNQPAWSNVPDATPLFAEYAQSLGLDPTKFAQDVESERVKERVEADQQRGESLGVTSTPTLFLNGERVPPANMSEIGLRAAIEATLHGSPSPSPLPVK